MADLILLAAKTGIDHRLATLLSSLPATRVTAYIEDAQGYQIRLVESSTEPLRLASYLGIAATKTLLLGASDWLCVHGYRVIGGHAYALIVACVPKLPSKIVNTLSLPTTLRRVHRAVLDGYVSRMLESGSSTERIAARLVLNGAPAAMLLIFAEAPRRTPIGIFAGRRFCVKHGGRWLAASTTRLGDCTLLEDAVATLKLQAGIPRVTVSKLSEYRR